MPTTPKFSKGDKVRLVVSKKPAMVVTEVGGHVGSPRALTRGPFPKKDSDGSEREFSFMYECAWFAGSNAKKETFPEEALEPSDDE